MPVEAANPPRAPSSRAPAPRAHQPSEPRTHDQEPAQHGPSRDGPWGAPRPRSGHHAPLRGRRRDRDGWAQARQLLPHLRGPGQTDGHPRPPDPRKRPGRFHRPGGKPLAAEAVERQRRVAMNLTGDPIPRLVRDLAVPASVGFFFNTMFDVVDTWWAGRISTQAQAALSLSFPGVLHPDRHRQRPVQGATALIANALGSANLPRARAVAAQALLLGGVAGLLMTRGGLARRARPVPFPGGHRRSSSALPWPT